MTEEQGKKIVKSLQVIEACLICLVSLCLTLAVGSAFI